MTNLFDALEFCLREVEEGGDMETALRRFPEYADELRPILETSVKARAMAVPEPSPEVVRRSRARVMQRAAELREARVPAARRQGVSLFQRFALSFALAAIFLLSGNGLLSASASALPGESLYPVKRGWESVRLFFIFDSEARALLEDEFENERLHEVNELLSEGRYAVIDFAGVFMQVNGVTYISGVQVILPANVTIPPNGTAVLVSGQTNASGFIEVLTFELLPEGSVVPSGSPIEVELEDAGAAPSVEPTSETGPTQTSGNEAGAEEVEVLGNLQSISITNLLVNGLNVFLDSTEIVGTLCVGAQVEVKGYYAEDGRFVATRVESKGGCDANGSSSGGAGNENQNGSSNSNQNTNNSSSGSNQNTNDGSSGNSNSDDNTNSDDDSNSNSGDDNSGSGGGGGDDD